ncbi:MAG: nucleotide sugar dehydrogenase, partial [Cetobacterium sp.]|uniref:nucleotide sugar dehydrogenase n=1 Tax=Cetobacterium sp. TaxID=2071632 RepID=UPI003F3E43F9
MKITVVGMGYVGLSNGILLAQDNEVKILDIEKEKVQMLNERKSPIMDKEIIEYLSKKKLNLKGTLDKKYAYKNADYIIIAVPTNYNEEKRALDTEIIENTIGDILDIESESTIIIKSTVPVGYTEEIKRKFGIENIIFSPEFLREGKALYDNLYPTRIIMGERSRKAEKFVELLLKGGIKKDVPVLYMNSTEAEAVKLFSNTYLALRIAYFNELDTYAEIKNLNSGNIIEGISLDPRIGNYYN